MTLSSMPSFSSHNVALPDGRQTAPQHVLVAESGAFQAALRELERVFGSSGGGRVTVADLGCLEGGYAAGFARAGYDVTGIEVRQENYECSAWLGEALSLPNLRFIRGDASEILQDMQFDAVFCSGLLYHLSSPVAFLNLLGQVTRRLLILNTHYSMEGGHPESVHLPTSSWCEYGDFQHEGRAGHWYHEQDDRWASYGGTSSFWLRREDLLLAVQDAGFAQVSEVQDWKGAGSAGVPWGTGGATADRGLFVAFR